MQINVGFEMIFDCPKPTPMIFNLNVHFTRVSDLIGRDALVFEPPVPMAAYRDDFGNWCTRIVAPAGRTRITADAIVNDSGLPDVIVPDAQQIPVADLPEDTLIFLLGSRYCDTDRLSQTAWNLFGQTPPGWDRVQAICDYVHRHITFDYQQRGQHAHGVGSLQRTGRRLPRFHPPGRCVLSLHEHPGPLLHRVPRRHRHAAAVRSDGFRRLVRGVPRRAVAHLRRAQQHPADRPGADRAGPRRRRCRAEQCVRPRRVGELSGLDRRGGRVRVNGRLPILNRRESSANMSRTALLMKGVPSESINHLVSMRA